MDVIEPYYFHLSEDKSIDYIKFDPSIDLSQFVKIRGVVHDVGLVNSEIFRKKTEFIHSNYLKFPFDFNITSEVDFQEIILNCSFKSGFVCGESLINILLSSDYSISLELYRAINGEWNPNPNGNDYIGRVNFENITSYFGFQDYFSMLDLLDNSFNRQRLLEAFQSGNNLIINITSKFKGRHQGSLLQGHFALKILQASLSMKSVVDGESDDLTLFSPIFIQNFSISDSDKIDAISFDINYSAIPQINTWAFIIENNYCVLRPYQIIKNLNLLDIEFFNPEINKWIALNYIIYDHVDDPFTFSYCVDGNILDLYQFDCLNNEDQIFQLKYRFVINAYKLESGDFTKVEYNIRNYKINAYYSPESSGNVLNPKLYFSTDITKLISPDERIQNSIQEILLSLKFDCGTYISDQLFEASLNKLFSQTALYYEDVKVYIFDIENNRNLVENPNAIDFVGENIYDFIKYRNGRYYIDFLIDYKWTLKGFHSYNNTIFDVHAYIKLKDCHAKVKFLSIEKEFISPFDIGEGNNLYTGDITNNGIKDIGFRGGFLERNENNERLLLKYSFSYYYDSNYDHILIEDQKIVFAEFLQDVKFESNKLVHYLYNDIYPPFKQLIIGDQITLNLTTNGNVDKAYLFLPSFDQRIGEFSKVTGSNNKFVYNWTNIETLLLPYYNSGDQIEIVIELFDLQLGLNDTLKINCLLDFEAPEIDILLGDGNTQYSLDNFASPWTNYGIDSTDNIDHTINFSDYYNARDSAMYYQVSVYNFSDNLVYRSESLPLLNQIGTLSDLNIPLKTYLDPEKYYYRIECATTDIAGNLATKSSENLYISTELFIEYENNLVNVNELSEYKVNNLNFTLLDAEGNLVNNQTLYL